MGLPGTLEKTDSDVKVPTKEPVSETVQQSTESLKKTVTEPSKQSVTEPVKQATTETNQTISKSNKPQMAGSLMVNLNGIDKNYSTNNPIDNKGINSSWTIFFYSRDSIYIYHYLLMLKLVIRFRQRMDKYQL
ncbi:hypothetical protein GTO91_01795 [Heliobacterium undosum]|uniref:Uncharacterized protein n=1 Tax=Heliomicrobium undosum TaxID=121734 RepID=A0A845KZ91_9FIRM|nr:hypothetical protein [Heliomicrobium undosum]MZP28456.1 hypothetical protein [Heliomicrobium undosum]